MIGDSDRWRELVERGRDAESDEGVVAEFVVASAEVLHEGVEKSEIGTLQPDYLTALTDVSIVRRTTQQRVGPRMFRSRILRRVVPTTAGIGSPTSGGRRSQAIPRFVGTFSAFAVLMFATGCNVNYVLRSSTPDPGTGQTSPNGRSWAPSVSADGRYTVFLSNASNLVTGDTNSSTDVFVRDNVGGSVVRFTDGAVDSTSRPAISADGSRVAYTVVLSGTSTLAVVNRATVSVAFTKAANPPQQAINPSLSNDGTAVAWEFYNPDLGRRSIAYYTPAIGPSWITPNGSTTGQAYHPRINGAGTSVLFDSTSSSYVANDYNGFSDVFRWDPPPGSDTVERVSLTSTGEQGNDDSAYGTWVPGSSTGAVAFASFASNLVSGDTGGHQDIFVSVKPEFFGYGTTARLVAGNDDSSLPSLSSDGRFMSFISRASDLVPGDTNGALDVFVRDLSAPSGTPILWRASVAYLGAQADGPSSYPQISGSGRWVSYESDATNLLSDTNGVTDVFTGYAGKVTVTSITPSLFTRGVTNYPVTIKGAGFRAPVQVTASDSAATFSNVTVVNESTITANITVSITAPASATLEVAVDGAPILAGTGSSGQCGCISTIP